MLKFSLGLFFSLVAIFSAAQSVETNKDLLNQIIVKSRAKYTADSIKAVQRGLPFTIEMENDRIKTFKGFDGEIPLYVSPTTLNEVNTYYGSNLWAAPYNVKGDLHTAGLWEAYVSAGAAFPDITDLNFLQNGVGSTRITLLESGGNSWHAQNVALRMISDGAGSASTVGPAKEGSIRSFNVTNDASEMATEAGAGMLISNHSYGYWIGWADNETYNSITYRKWLGVSEISLTEDYKFGRYGGDDQAYDDIAYAAPYYLMVKAAGNERNDNGSTTWSYWMENYTGPGSLPPGDIWLYQSGGFDKIGSTNTPIPEKDGGTDGYDGVPFGSCGKNNMIVGAIADIAGGYNQPSDVNVRSFSVFGPTDDGRIKPDIVAPGAGGTSYAAPNVTGAGLLLQELYKNTNGVYMRAATLKGLFIHTAYEAGTTTGPDYRHGWGLMNPVAAADAIINANGTDKIIEDILANGGSNKYYAYLDVSDDLSVTISWTDPSGAPTALTYTPSDLDNITPMLVNDLDVRLKQISSATITSPYVLDPLNPANAATKSDNFRDNVEQIELASAATGWYEISVAHKGGLVNNFGNPSSQAFSLIFSGFSGYSCTQDFSATAKLWDGSSWSPSSPTSGEDVIILGNLTLAGNATYGNVIIETGVTVTVNAGVTLSIQKSLSSASTSYFMGAGNVQMNGTVAQNICGFVDIENLEIDNATGVGITDANGITGVTGLMTLTNGIFTTNNKLWLRSSASANKKSYAQLTENGGTLSGEITFQNTVVGGTGSWRHIGSPVNTTIGDVLEDMDFYYVAQNKGSVYSWDAATSAWAKPTGTSDAFNGTTAFTCYFGQSGTKTYSAMPFTIEVTGVPNTGLIDNALYYGASTTLSNGAGWDLISNPYPENLDWDAIQANITGGINSAYYVWDGENGQYLSYNGITGTASRYIAPMQAFFVKLGSAADETSTAFDFTNAVRASSAPSAFLKTTPPQIVLSAQQKNSIDKMYFTFQNGASFNYEAELDAFKLFSEVEGVAHLYQHNSADSLDFSISGLPSNLSEYYIPLHYKNSQSNSATIALDKKTVNGNWEIWLEDLYTGKQIDLNKTSYLFTHEKTNNSARFILHLVNPNGQGDHAGNTTPIVWVDESFINIAIKKETLKELRVINLSGQVLYQVKNPAGTNLQIPKNMLNARSGVVFVQMRTNRGVYSEKIIIAE